MNTLENAGYTLETVGGNLTAYVRHCKHDIAVQIQQAWDIPEAPEVDGPCFVCVIDPDVDPEDTLYREVESFAEAIKAANKLIDGANAEPVETVAADFEPGDLIEVKEIARIWHHGIKYARVVKVDEKRVHVRPTYSSHVEPILPALLILVERAS